VIEKKKKRRRDRDDTLPRPKKRKRGKKGLWRRGLRFVEPREKKKKKGPARHATLCQEKKKGEREKKKRKGGRKSNIYIVGSKKRGLNSLPLSGGTKNSVREHKKREKKGFCGRASRERGRRKGDERRSLISEEKKGGGQTSLFPRIEDPHPIKKKGGETPIQSKQKMGEEEKSHTHGKIPSFKNRLW